MIYICKMDFNFNDDSFFIFIENREYKSVFKLQRDYEWTSEFIGGPDYFFGTLWSNMDIDDIIESLSKNYDTVELIDEMDIDDYLA